MVLEAVALQVLGQVGLAGVAVGHIGGAADRVAEDRQAAVAVPKIQESPAQTVAHLAGKTELPLCIGARRAEDRQQRQREEH